MALDPAYVRPVTTTAQTEAPVAGARAGLAARGVVYVLLGILTLYLAVRPKGQETDQRGAVTSLAAQPFGKLLVIVLAVGVVAYAVWMLAQVVLGVAGEEDSTAKRLRCLGSGIAYAALAVTCIAVLRGSSKSQTSQQETLTARVMHHGGGRLLVAVVGLVVIGVGVGLLVQGVRATFMDRMHGMTPHTANVVRRLGQVGSASRGVVVALAGVLLVDAAWTFDPKKAKGIDGALKTLLHQPYGRWLTGLAALGLLTFGLFCFAEAKYRSVRVGSGPGAESGSGSGSVSGSR